MRNELHEIVLCDKVDEIKTYQLKDYDDYDHLGMTPLLYAVFSGCEDLVEALLELGCDPNKCDTNGDSPLYFSEDDFDLEEVTKVLKKYGARK